MKINRILLCILCFVLVFLCCSCFLLKGSEYICDIEQVESIQIVKLAAYVKGEYRFEYTVLADISDHAAFVERLNKVKQSEKWTDPGQLYVGDKVIKIEYRNGDYDLLDDGAQYLHRSGENQYGYWTFDSEQYNALIADYLS